MDRIQKLRERTYDDTRFLGDIEFFTLFFNMHESGFYDIAYMIVCKTVYHVFA